MRISRLLRKFYRTNTRECKVYIVVTATLAYIIWWTWGWFTVIAGITMCYWINCVIGEFTSWKRFYGSGVE